MTGRGNTGFLSEQWYWAGCSKPVWHLELVSEKNWNCSVYRYKWAGQVFLWFRPKAGVYILKDGGCGKLLQTFKNFKALGLNQGVNLRPANPNTACCLISFSPRKLAGKLPKRLVAPGTLICITQGWNWLPSSALHTKSDLHLQTIQDHVGFLMVPQVPSSHGSSRSFFSWWISLPRACGA